jgi:hypothetical protein
MRGEEEGKLNSRREVQVAECIGRREWSEVFIFFSREKQNCETLKKKTKYAHYIFKSREEQEEGREGER